MIDSKGGRAADNDLFAASDGDLQLAAQALRRVRSSLRSDGLPGEVLADTALDMLLALYLQSADRGAVDEDDVTGSTPSPPLVSQRWLSALRDLGLVELTTDHGRHGARLTPEGKNKVATSLAIVIEGHRRLMDEQRSAKR